MLSVVRLFLFFFFSKQKTAYEMRISDWSSDVCSSDLFHMIGGDGPGAVRLPLAAGAQTPHRLEPPYMGLGERGRGGRVVPEMDVDTVPPLVRGGDLREIGRASCRERVCQYV